MWEQLYVEQLLKEDELLLEQGLIEHLLREQVAAAAAAEVGELEVATNFPDLLKVGEVVVHCAAPDAAHCAGDGIKMDEVVGTSGLVESGSPAAAHCAGDGIKMDEVVVGSSGLVESTARLRLTAPATASAWSRLVKSGSPDAAHCAGDGIKSDEVVVGSSGLVKSGSPVAVNCAGDCVKMCFASVCA